MDDRQSHDELQAELRTELERRGLPPAYIARYLAELDDHFTDLLQERNLDMSTARKPDFSVNNLHDRLGNPTQLAAFAADQYNARSFFGRHPILTFLITPLPLLAAIWMASIAIMVLAINGTEYSIGHSISSEDHPWLVCILCAFIVWELVAFVPLATALLFCRVARRNAIDWRWPVAACSLLALLVSFVRISWQPCYVVGFGFDPSAQWLFVNWLPRFALALGVGLALVWRSQQQFAAAE
jgi:hypothetical protein